MLIFVEVERGAIGEENCFFHFKFNEFPSRDEIEKLILDEDCGFDSHYCTFNYYRLD